MVFFPLPVGGTGERFGIRTSRKKDSKGSEEGGKAGREGTCRHGGGGVLKGKREGVRRSLGQTEGGERDVRHRV